MKKLTLILTWIIAIALASYLAFTLASQVLNGRTASVQFETLSSATASSGFDVSSLSPSKHTVQVVVTGGPATCSIQLEGTLDAISSSSTWANLSGSQTCTSTVTFHVTERAVKGVRVNVTALTGGTSPGVSAKYTGVQ